MKKKKLFRAAGAGDEETVRKLAECGARVNARSFFDGVTPLHLSARHGGAGVSRVLIEKGADVNPVDKARETPLHWAAERGHAEVVRLLLEKGADPSARTSNFGETPLHSAARAGHFRAVREIIRGGADVMAKTWHGETPLHRACSGKGDRRTIKLLLDGGAEVSSRCSELAETPLHKSGRADRPEAARILLENGADPCAQDIDGRSPLEAARKHGSFRTASVIEKFSGP